MGDGFYEIVPFLDNFADVADPSKYISLPDDWCIGVSDVVNSRAAIDQGFYKSVNLAAAGTISAVANELEGELRLFIFNGDGARFAVPANQAERAADALSRVAMWVKRDLDLELRTGAISVAEVRAAGFDIRTAFWRASSHVSYAMFIGDGLEWAEGQLKNGSIKIEPASAEAEPNLTGLSCQWGPIEAKQGKIVSLIVKPLPDVPRERFAETISQTIALLNGAEGINPVPTNGPDVRWPATVLLACSHVLRGRVGQSGGGERRSL